MSPIVVAGVGLFFAGGVVFLALLFGSGGAAKSRQMAVLWQLLRGQHGRGRRLALWAALAAGALTLFAGVSAAAVHLAPGGRSQFGRGEFRAGLLRGGRRQTELRKRRKALHFPVEKLRPSPLRGVEAVSRRSGARSSSRS